MPEFFCFVLAAAFCFLGMAWLAAAMRVHWLQIHCNYDVEPNRMLLRIFATLSFVLAYLCCLEVNHVSMAVLVLIMYLSGAAFLVAMLLTHIPAALRVACPLRLYGI